MTKMLSVISAAVLVFSVADVQHVFAAETLSGACGDRITWHIDKDTMTLTLEGTGPMYDYADWTAAAWAGWNFEIEHIVISDGIETIGDYAFAYFANVTEITIPDSVTRIGNGAFWVDMGLETVHMSKNCKSLGNEAFYVNQSLKEIDLPEGLLEIGSDCFRDDDRLSDLKVPDSVTYIGRNGLTTCAGWYRKQTEDFLIVGDGILYRYMGNESQVTVPDGVKLIAADAFSEVTYYQAGLLGDSDFADFSPNENIEQIILPDSVTVLSDYACVGMEGLSSISLPQGLKTIGTNAFYGCTALRTLSVPSGVTDIGRGAFEQTAWLKAQTDDFLILGANILYRFQGRQHVVRIPDSVRRIMPDAIKEGVSQFRIVEVMIPDTDIEICPEAIICKNAAIAGKKGSAAEQYALENSIEFRDTEALPPSGRDMTLDYEKDVWAFGNWSEVFGGDYYLTDADRQALEALQIDTQNVNRDWSGSCAGLSITVILVKNGIFAPAELQSGAAYLTEIEPSEAVQSFINYYHCTIDKATGSVPYEADEKKFYRMLNLAKNVKYGESPFMLSFRTKTGSHAVVGYGQESGAWEFDGKSYDGRILIWDSNSPKKLNDDYCLYYDTETFDYCIPHYGVHVSEGADDNVGGILAVCNDLDILNAYPYPNRSNFETGDLNLDGSVTVADAVLMSRYLSAQATLSAAQMQAADLSGDGKVNAVDQTFLKRILIH